jgi:hypothetical protein
VTGEPFIVHCGKCSHEWAPCFTPVSADVLAKVAKRPCPACGSSKVLCGSVPRDTPDGDAVGWLTNGDTGISSMTIWSVMMGKPMKGGFGPDVPHDPADFGRCHRLLKVMPSWRDKLGLVAEKYPEWSALVEHWSELTALYEEELPRKMAPKLYARMRELRGEAA